MNKKQVIVIHKRSHFIANKRVFDLRRQFKNIRLLLNERINKQTKTHTKIQTAKV